ncbi:MAG: hypothetical protein KatS3mg057_2349 [Herpetosiphonaceae bacterium]|nr:MAG: hypothetical protein KatS3mg057_2349 [Herpetosiphonaceae bacterium]
MTIQGYKGEQRPLELLVEGGRARGRTSPNASWQDLDQSATDLFAPGGDLLGYLAAATNVEERAVALDDPRVPRAAQTRYTFDLNSASYANFMGRQLEEQMRRNGELPPGLSLDLARIYEGMRGSGEIWLDEEGLPIRQVLHLSFPPEKGALSWVEAEISTSFTRWHPSLGVTLGQVWENPALLPSALSLSPRAFDQLGFSFSFGALTLAGLALVVAYHRSRRLYAGLATALIVSMIAAPLLQANQAVVFFEGQTAKAEAAAMQEQQQRSAEQLRATLSQTGALSLAESFYIVLYQGIDGLLEIAGSSTGTEVLDDSGYVLALDEEAVTEIVPATLSGMHSFFVSEAAIELDGEEVASGVTISLTDATVVLESIGLSWPEPSLRLLLRSLWPRSPQRSSDRLLWRSSA